jgi:geranylgeranyl diphosphate synthase type II
VLAAMALLNQTYALLGKSSRGRELIRLATDCIGHRGMVAGQTIDLAVDADTRVDLREEHYLKTTALFRLAMVAPAIAAGASEPTVEALGEFGRCAGMAYQLIDDACDLEADAIKDGAWDGVTPAELRERARGWVVQAKAALHEQFGDGREVRFLVGFADWLLAGAQTPAAS